MAFKLVPEIKAQWVEALRSDAYKQGHQALYAYDGKHEARYCCLGVLCSLVAEQTGKHLLDYQERDGQELPGDNLLRLVDENHFDHKGEEYEEIWGCEADYEGIAVDDSPVTLYKLNDAGASFREIADIIEGQF